MLRRSLLALGVLLGLTLPAAAQTTPIYNLTGNETVVITLQSGSSIRIPIGQLTNVVGISPVGASATTNSSPSGLSGYLLATGAITTWNVTLPNPAYQGQVLYVANGHSSALAAAVSVRVGPGTQTQTMAATYDAATLAPSTPAGWIYDLSNSKWHRVQ